MLKMRRFVMVSSTDAKAALVVHAPTEPGRPGDDSASRCLGDLPATSHAGLAVFCARKTLRGATLAPVRTRRVCSSCSGYRHELPGTAILAIAAGPASGQRLAARPDHSKKLARQEVGRTPETGHRVGPGVAIIALRDRQIVSSSDMEHAQLEFTDSSGKRRVVSIDDSPFLIGRSASNHLALASAEISREHAAIMSVDDGIVLQDRHSRAGTFVNDKPVEEHALSNGDRIRLGPTIELTVSIGAVPSDSYDSNQTSSTSTAITDLRQTSTLLESLRALGSARVLDQVLDLVLDSAIEITGAERGFLMLVADDGSLEFKTGRRRDAQSLSVADFQTSRKIPEEVFENGETRVFEDLFDSPVASDHEATLSLGIRNVLCSPLTTVRYVDSDEATSDDRRIGVLYLDSRKRQSFRSTSTRAALETLANEAAGAIENARLYRESQEMARLERDLQTAQEFQQALLPRAAPNLGFFEAAASMLPCRLIGGDFYEYVSLANGALGFTLGDVAGKGAPAGLLGARIQEIFSAQAPAIVEPAETIARINSTLLGRALESRFVTMFYGVLQPDGTLRYCNAGHNPPVLVTSTGVKRLTTGGLIVGLFDDAEFEEETLQLAAGDLLVVFSDGISEAENDAEEEFGDDRIIQSIQATTDSAEPRVVLDRLFAHLREFTVSALQADDMTALILRYQG